MNKTQAIKATRNGAIAALISAAMTIVIVLIAIKFDEEKGLLAPFNDPVNFVDVVFVLICAIGMYRKSRVASVLIFVYFLAARINIAVETQAYQGLVGALIFLYFYGKAIQGSFVYHKLEKEDNPGYKATTKWTYILGIPSILVVVVPIGLLIMSSFGVITSTRVQAGSEIKTEDVIDLRSNGIIASDENIDYFYSQGLTSILESGNILTKDRVILYVTDESEGLQVYEIPLNEITDVVLESQGDTLNDSVYKVTTKDPDQWLKLFLSVEQKGDQKFVTALRDRLTR